METLVILVYNENPESIAEYLRSRKCPGRLLTASTPDAARRLIKDAEIVFAWKLPPEVYAQASNLRWIQSMGAGVEDLVANARIAPSVVMTRIVGQFGAPIAEYVFAEILYRQRNLAEARRLQQARMWQRFPFGSLKGQVIGVAGLGSIGMEIVRRARAFDMRIMGLSRHRHETGDVDCAYDGTEWGPFVRDLDYLVVTLPLSAATEGVVNQEVFSAMKPTAVVMNVGRGRVIDQHALIHAVRSKQIAGAVLDVFEEEPLPPDSPVWNLPGVVVTPHISGPSVDDEIGEFFLGNLTRFLQGQFLHGAVDRTLGY